MSREILRSMLTRAAHIEVRGGVRLSSLVTEIIDGVCIQCEGRPTWRNTLDGMQPTVAFHWFIERRRTSKAEVFRRFAKDTGGAA